MKGSYILLIDLVKDKEIKIGKLGNIFFKKGTYVYVGSALNNLEKRIQRYHSSEKKLHWHIDYFLKYAKIVDVYYKESNKKEECKIAKNFENFKKIEDFGCSDCNCESHLFYGNYHEILSVIDKLKLKKYDSNAKI